MTNSYLNSLDDIEFFNSDSNLIVNYAIKYYNLKTENIDHFISIFYDKEQKTLNLIFVSKNKLLELSDEDLEDADSVFIGASIEEVKHTKGKYFSDIEFLEMDLPKYEIKGKDAINYLINGDEVIDRKFIIKLIKRSLK